MTLGEICPNKEFFLVDIWILFTQCDQMTDIVITITFTFRHKEKVAS